MVLQAFTTGLRFSMMMPHEQLKAWQACLDLYVGVHRETAGWPRREWYGLAAQLRDAALSAGSNIAEGIGRKGDKEFARYLNISLGSLAEVAHQLRAAAAVGMLSSEDFEKLSSAQQTAGRLTWRLYAAVRKRLAQ